MTTEKLLVPRVIITAPWPNMDELIKVGDILTFHSLPMEKWKFDKDEGYFHPKATGYLSQKTIDTCHANFYRIEWWEHRSLSDIPDYVKGSVSGNVFPLAAYKQTEINEAITHGWIMNDNAEIELAFSSSFFNNLVPATKKEYEAYLSNKK